MGNYLLIVLAGFLVAGAYYTVQRGRQVVDVGAVVANSEYDVVARNAALTGYEFISQSLADNFVDHDTTLTWQGIECTASATVAGFEATIVSIATVTDAHGNPATYEVQAQVERAVPMPFEFALSAQNNIRLNGNISIFSLHPKRNANVHTNGDLRLNGSTSLVQGFGTYSGALQASAQAISDVFQPNHNPHSDPLVAPHPPVQIDPIDAAALAAAMPLDATSIGATTLFGSYDLGGTRQDPYIWYIDGDLSVPNDVNFAGYNVFLVTGEIDIDANILSDGPHGKENTVAFYTNGAINVGGGSDIEAQVFANDEIWFHGSARVFGNISSATGATFSGSTEIHYLPASAALTHQVWSGSKGLNLVGYGVR